ncbi:DUF2490 domain-containing protein [Tenacibaculum sp. 190524A02b]|uniref:DUF2490 domain-containing protein n=1 Tax=Tenacibaculum vairaonense TaxID=3137860 RepID=UPI0031FA611C
MKKVYLAIIITMSALSGIAQTNPENTFGAWYMYNGSHTLSNKFSLKSMAHFRFFEIGDDMQQFIGRLGANYKINTTLSATLGYAYLSTDTTYELDKGDFNEHRVYEDLNIKHKIAELGLAHRLRAEQRFFNSTTGHFIRYQLAFNYPICDKWSTYLYDEIFFDFDGEAFNQNWMGIGVKYKVSKGVKLQLGYMKIINDNHQGFDRVQIGVAINTNHQKKK